MCVIAEEVCALAKPLDVSTIKIQCLLDHFNTLTTPLAPTVVTYLQLLVTNQCTLKELIDAINARIDGITDWKSVV